jgi:hypothetical protein
LTARAYFAKMKVKQEEVCKVGIVAENVRLLKKTSIPLQWLLFDQLNKKSSAQTGFGNLGGTT